MATAEAFETDIPARMDRLPWARWHWLVVLALGAVWVLDGLEVTIVGAIGARLQDKETLALSAAEIGLAGAIYVAGGVAGALLFGRLTDRFGRKRLFMATLGLYLVATVATAFAWGPWSFFCFRFLTGMGIGGEYSAINSAIDELIPARVRGWVDLAINGSWWLGTAAGALLSLVLLDPSVLAKDVGWRVCFGLGAVLGLGILLTRRLVPESPRWLLMHGRVEEAEAIVRSIERQVSAGSDEPLERPKDTIELHPRGTVGFLEIGRTLFRDYRSRTVLGLALMSAQAFAYNAVFFTYALVLTTFYGVGDSSVGWYILPFAVGNFLGPLLLGRLFDVVGRRKMIAGTYGLAGVLLAITGGLFAADLLTAFTQTVAWTVIFFFASAGASAAYLTVSEVFPLEIRAMAIAFFYSAATAVGGISGPLLFGILVGTKSQSLTMIGFLIGAVWLIFAAVMEALLGVDAEQKSLEEVAEPLGAGGDKGGEAPRGRDRGAWSPRPASRTASGRADSELETEIAALEAAASSGPLRERELLARAGARRWGPGRGPRAVDAAVRAGRLVRRGRTYASTR
jgi:MFS family permease